MDEEEVKGWSNGWYPGMSRPDIIKDGAGEVAEWSKALAC